MYTLSECVPAAQHLGRISVVDSRQADSGNMDTFISSPDDPCNFQKTDSDEVPGLKAQLDAGNRLVQGQAGHSETA